MITCINLLFSQTNANFSNAVRGVTRVASEKFEERVARGVIIMTHENVGKDCQQSLVTAKMPETKVEKIQLNSQLPTKQDVINNWN